LGRIRREERFGPKKKGKEEEEEEETRRKISPNV